MQRAVLTTARLAGSLAASPAAIPAASARAASSKAANSLYKFVFSRNITYAAYIVSGAIVLETFYGSTLDGLWNTMNKGVRCHKIWALRGISPALCVPVRRFRQGDRRT